MKNSLILLTLIFLASCQTDDFYETDRYFLTDKDIYHIGDKFELTVIIESDKEKEIRFYENFKNLQISFSLINEQKNIYNGSWSKSSDKFLKDTTIVKHDLSKGEPFKKKFTGKVENVNDSVVIIIPELNFLASFDENKFDENTLVRIHGLCMPINSEVGASIEEFIEAKDIKIVKEKRSTTTAIE